MNLPSSKRRAWQCALIVGVAIGAVSCQDQVRDGASRLDQIEQSIQEYGTASVSSPLLAPAIAGKSPFAFELSKKPDDFFADAQSKIEGGSAQSNQQMAVLELGLRGQFDPAALLQYQQQLQQYQGGVARTQQFQQVSDNGAMQQYQSQLALYNTSQNLQRTAIQQQYVADMEAASKETDPVKKADDQAQAEKKRADALAALATSAAPTPPTVPNAPSYPTETAPPSIDSNLLPTPNTSAFNGSTFSAPGGVLGGLSPTVSDRSAIISAAGDTATAGIFRLLGDPAAQIQFKDKKILFGTAMVSVNPGWRTKKGYAADISVRVTYDYVPARQEIVEKVYKSKRAKNPKDPVLGWFELAQPALKNPSSANAQGGTKLPLTSERPFENSPEGSAEISTPIFASAAALPMRERPTFAGNGLGSSNILRAGNGQGSGSISTAQGSIPAELSASSQYTAPLVAAVSPMTDVQSLELDNSARSQTEVAADIAAALQYAGLKAQAEMFASYAKRHERDVRTRTAAATINAYDNSGGVIGFQVGPRLKAIEEAAGNDAKSADVLDRQSFPVLLLVGMDSSDLGLKFRYDDRTLIIVEPVLRFNQSVRWTALRSGRPSRMTPSQQLEWSRQLAEMGPQRLLTRSEKQELFDRLRDADDAINNPTALGKDVESWTALHKVFFDDSLFPRDQMDLRSPTRNGIFDHVAGAFRGIAHDYNNDWTLNDLLRIRRIVMDGEKAPAGTSGSNPSNQNTVARDTLQCSGDLAVAKSLIEGAWKRFDNLPAQADDDVTLVRDRAAVLGDQVEGSYSFQGIPTDYLAPDDPVPAFTAVQPASITYDPRKPPSLMPILASGQNLDPLVKLVAKSTPSSSEWGKFVQAMTTQIHAEAIDGLTGKLHGQAEIDGANDAGILLSYKPQSASSMPRFVAFKIWTDSGLVACTPPVQLTEAYFPFPPREDVTVTYTKSGKSSDGKDKSSSSDSTETFTVPTGNADLVKSWIEHLSPTTNKSDSTTAPKEPQAGQGQGAIQINVPPMKVDMSVQPLPPKSP